MLGFTSCASNLGYTIRSGEVREEFKRVYALSLPPKKLRYITVRFQNNTLKDFRIQFNPEKEQFQFQSGTRVGNIAHLTPDSLALLADLKRNPYD